MGPAESTCWMRWAGVAAVAGGLLVLALAIPFAIAFGIEDPQARGTTRWVMDLRPRLEFALEFGSPRTVYETYGRVFDLAYLLVMPCVIALHRLQCDPARPQERSAYRWLLASLVATFLGVAGDYWLNGLGFALEVIGLLGLCVSTTRYGVVTRRVALVPRGLSHLLIAGGPGALVGLAATGHIPSGPTIALMLPWLTIGVWFALGGGQARTAPAVA